MQSSRLANSPRILRCSTLAYLPAQWFLMAPIGFMVEEVFFRGPLDTHVYGGSQGTDWLSAIVNSLLWGMGTYQVRPYRQDSFSPQSWSCSLLIFLWTSPSGCNGARVASWRSMIPLMPCLGFEHGRYRWRIPGDDGQGKNDLLG